MNGCTSGVPMAQAITALDTLAVIAGIPNPGRTIALPAQVLEEVKLPSSPVSREELAAYALRRCAAWAAALVDDLPPGPS